MGKCFCAKKSFPMSAKDGLAPMAMPRKWYNELMKRILICIDFNEYARKRMADGKWAT